MRPRPASAVLSAQHHAALHSAHRPPTPPTADPHHRRDAPGSASAGGFPDPRRGYRLWPWRHARYAATTTGCRSRSTQRGRFTRSIRSSAPSSGSRRSANTASAGSSGTGWRWTAGSSAAPTVPAAAAPRPRRRFATRCAPTRADRWTSAVSSVDEKRRLVRRLLEREGRGFAEACGFPVTNNPSSLFRLLYLALLAGGRRDQQRAVRLAQAVRDAGWDTAARLAAAGHHPLTATLRAAGAGRDANRLADTLGQLAAAVVDRYRGDLRRLRSTTRRDPAVLRRALTDLPSVDSPAVVVFLREGR